VPPETDISMDPFAEEHEVLFMDETKVGVTPDIWNILIGKFATGMLLGVLLLPVLSETTTM